MGANVKDTLLKLKESLGDEPAPVLAPVDGLDTLVAEIKILSQQTAGNIIEIGKRLIRAKTLVAHGNWEQWLTENLELSTRRAQQFMKVAEEYGKTNTYSFLTPSKAIALLDVPAADREAFIAQPHDVGGEQKTVDEMTSRELAAAVKALKDAERARAEKDKLIQDQAKRLQSLTDDLEQSRLAQKVLADTKKPETIVKTIEKETIPDDYERIKKDLQAANNNVASLHARLAAYETDGQRQDQLKMELRHFTHSIEKFVRENATLGYFGNIYAKASPQAQREYDKSLAMLEKWCRDMRDQAIIPKGEQIYEMEA